MMMSPSLPRQKNPLPYTPPTVLRKAPGPFLALDKPFSRSCERHVLCVVLPSRPPIPPHVTIRGGDER